VNFGDGELWGRYSYLHIRYKNLTDGGFTEGFFFNDLRLERNLKGLIGPASK
jgi:hypothetical protein